MCAQAEQAIFTSLPRRGRAGYHLVSQSRGLGAADAQALARWAPSHGALMEDSRNQTSVNFHPLPSGRFALSRTSAGPPEYSGRGGPQLYTHFLIVDEAVMQSAGFHPISIYLDAIARGYLLYQPDPGKVLEPVMLSRLHSARDAAGWASQAVERGLPPLGHLQRQLQFGHPVRFAYSGDRIDLAECLIGLLSPEIATRTSFSTSLVPSSDRPFVLTLVNGT
jgi:GTPase-associated protein 1, N-terminal domain type 2